MLVAVFAPAGGDWKGGIAALVVLGPLSYLFPYVVSQFGSEYGRRAQTQLWQRWGGPPTTLMLRHGNAYQTPYTLNRIHDKLRQIGLPVPTPKDQEQNPRDADTRFEACTEELKRRTRDTSKYPLVHKNL